MEQMNTGLDVIKNTQKQKITSIFFIIISVAGRQGKCEISFHGKEFHSKNGLKWCS
jgi:hypothetical protein